MMLTESGWSAQAKNLAKGKAFRQLRTHYLSLAIHGPERGHDPKRYAVGARSSLHCCPGIRRGRYEVMLSPAFIYFGDS